MRLRQLRKLPDEATVLPAVAVVVAGGFLTESAPMARHSGVVFLLLSHKQRQRVSTVIPDFDNLPLRLPPHWDAAAVLHLGAERRRRLYWHNAENLWVAARWLCEVAEPRVTSFTYGSDMIFKLAHAAPKDAK